MAPVNQPIYPPAVIGILGKGQLGRMLALVARRMGYQVAVFGPGSGSPAGQAADREWDHPYDDLDAVRRFARSVAVVTYEFENVPLATALAAAEICPVRPDPRALAVAQNRQREKMFLRQQGLPVAPFATIDSLAALQASLREIGLPGVLKSAESGYDGKGQHLLTRAEEAAPAWEAIGRQRAVYEQFIDLTLEISVVAARDSGGRFAAYEPLQNDHRDHILDVSVCPAPLPGKLAEEAVNCAQAILEALDVIGVFCVEFFVTRSGRLLINEIAPRPHNSGHLTIESHVTSQFEQQLRAICALPLGDVTQLKPAAMANLLGDLWQDGTPNWAAAAGVPAAKVHLYGKETARPGRKMGHITALGETIENAREIVMRAREALTHREN